MKHERLRGSDLIHCWLERRIQPLQHHGDRLTHQITSDKKDKMRVTSSRLAPKDYNTLMQYLIKERVERKVLEVSMKMYTTNRPLTPVNISTLLLHFVILFCSFSDSIFIDAFRLCQLKKLSESELAPLEGYASD